MEAREASSQPPTPPPVFFVWGLALPKKDLMLYSECTNISRPVRIVNMLHYALQYCRTHYPKRSKSQVVTIDGHRES